MTQRPDENNGDETEVDEDGGDEGTEAGDDQGGDEQADEDGGDEGTGAEDDQGDDEQADDNGATAAQATARTTPRMTGCRPTAEPRLVRLAMRPRHDVRW